MKQYNAHIILILIAACLTGCVLTDGKSKGQSTHKTSLQSGWQQEFGLEKRTLAPTGRNPYFVLEPGFQLSYASKHESLTITVLNDTVKVGEITTRVVEEREWKDRKLTEVSRNFFAVCPETKDIFYFGEEVDDYRNGKLVGHGGAWRADKPGNKAGLIMPGSPTLGMKYYQEMAPGVAMDRAQIVSLSEALKTPAGTFTNCLKTQEGSGLKTHEREFKVYASGIGLLKEGDMLLTKYGFINKK